MTDKYKELLEDAAIKGQTFGGLLQQMQDGGGDLALSLEALGLEADDVAKRMAMTIAIVENEQAFKNVPLQGNEAVLAKPIDEMKDDSFTLNALASGALSQRRDQLPEIAIGKPTVTADFQSSAIGTKTLGVTLGGLLNDGKAGNDADTLKRLAEHAKKNGTDPDVIKRAMDQVNAAGKGGYLNVDASRKVQDLLEASEVKGIAPEKKAELLTKAFEEIDGHMVKLDGTKIAASAEKQAQTAAADNTVSVPVVGGHEAALRSKSNSVPQSVFSGGDVPPLTLNFNDVVQNGTIFGPKPEPVKNFGADGATGGIGYVAAGVAEANKALEQQGATRTFSFGSP